MSARLREARLLAGLTKAEVARRLGAHRTQVALWEDEEKAVPSVRYLSEYPAALGYEGEAVPIVLGYLLTGIGSADPDRYWEGATPPEANYAVGVLQGALITAEMNGEKNPVQAAFEGTEKLLVRQRRQGDLNEVVWQQWLLMRQSAIVIGAYVTTEELDTSTNGEPGAAEASG